MGMEYGIIPILLDVVVVISGICTRNSKILFCQAEQDFDQGIPYRINHSNSDLFFCGTKSNILHLDCF